MKTTQVLENIRADLVKEMKPMFLGSNFSSPSDIPNLDNVFRTLQAISLKTTYRIGINILFRNGYECVLHNIFQKELDYPHRLSFRIISASLAGLTSSLILESDRNIGNTLIYPIWQGIIFGVDYMRQNSEETKLYFNTNYPQQMKALKNSKIYKTIEKVYTLFTDPGSAYATEQELMEMYPQLNQILGQHPD